MKRKWEDKKIEKTKGLKQEQARNMENEMKEIEVDSRNQDCSQEERIWKSKFWVHCK